VLGNKNRLSFQLIAQDQITGGGAEADVISNHFRLPCRAVLVDVDFSAQTISTTTTTEVDLVVYSGVALATGTSVATGSLADTVLVGNGTLATALKDKIYDANQEFCLSEDTTATETIDGLCAVLTFREWEG